MKPEEITWTRISHTHCRATDTNIFKGRTHRRATDPQPGVNGAAPPAPAHNHSRGFELGQFIHRVEDGDYNG